MTKQEIVDLMLDRAGFLPTINLSNYVVVDPAAKEGAFAIEIIKRLHTSSLKFKFSFQEALKNIQLYEINPTKASALKEQVKEQLISYSAFLPDELICNADFLLETPKKCDLIIGLPPYVRYENIPETKRQQYQDLFINFTENSNISMAFYEKGLEALKPGGVLSYICSDLWLERQFMALRECMGLPYAFKEIIELMDGQSPNGHEMNANPVITTLTQKTNGTNEQYYSLVDVRQLDTDTQTTDSQKNKALENWFRTHLSNGGYDTSLATIEEQSFTIKTANDPTSISSQLADRQILSGRLDTFYLVNEAGEQYLSNGFCYISGKNRNLLLLLAALLKSSFVAKQFFKNRKSMGTTPRCISQLKILQLPALKAIPQPLSKAIVKAYLGKDYEQIDVHVKNFLLESLLKMKTVIESWDRE